MKNCILASFLLLISALSYGQIVPPERTVDWTLAGLRDTSTVGFVTVDMQSAGAIGDGVTSNSNLVHTLIENSAGQGIILDFPAGQFLFDTTLSVRTNNVIIRGAGQENTTFLLDMSGLFYRNSRGIFVRGREFFTKDPIIQSVYKDSSSVFVNDGSIYAPGDWLAANFNDTALVFSAWARGSVGQVLKIQSIVGNQLFFESPLRLDMDLSQNPFLRPLEMIENVGIECLKIKRIDDTSPVQSNSIEFRNSANCWVSGIESDTTNFSHVMIVRSSNIYIGNSYFHHAFEFGGGGRAYGVNLAYSAGECLIENNIFERLRHSMLVQAGANGNVFAYNFSTDPYWVNTDPIIPADAAGDMVLHGNLPFANLFESNIGQSMIIDNSHAGNGPFNTFLRNSAAKFGIFFNDTSSPSQNFVGNMITNTTFPYSTFNYTIVGADHFIHGNNNKGTIHPAGTANLSDISYAYTQRPDFVPVSQWGAIGTPNPTTNPGNQAFDRFVSGNTFGGSCGSPLLDIEEQLLANKQITVYPNTSDQLFYLEADFKVATIEVYHLTGQLLNQFSIEGYSTTIDSRDWPTGIYMLKIIDANQHFYTQKIIKSKSP